MRAGQRVGRMLILPRKARASRAARAGRQRGRIRAAAPVAQLDRAPGFEPGGSGFESLRARHSCCGPSRVGVEALDLKGKQTQEALQEGIKRASAMPPRAEFGHPLAKPLPVWQSTVPWLAKGEEGRSCVTGLEHCRKSRWRRYCWAPWPTPVPQVPRVHKQDMQRQSRRGPPLSDRGPRPRLSLLQEGRRRQVRGRQPLGGVGGHRPARGSYSLFRLAGFHLLVEPRP